MVVVAVHVDDDADGAVLKPSVTQLLGTTMFMVVDVIDFLSSTHTLSLVSILPENFQPTCKGFFFQTLFTPGVVDNIVQYTDP